MQKTTFRILKYNIVCKRNPGIEVSLKQRVTALRETKEQNTNILQCKQQTGVSTCHDGSTLK